MASLTYDSFFDDVFNLRINLVADTFYMALVTSSYVPAQGSNTKLSDITNEATGTGYTQGGKSVTVTISKNTTTHKNLLTFSTPSWAASTITARAGVLYQYNGGDATQSRLVAYADFLADITSSNSTFTAVDVGPLTISN